MGLNIKFYDDKQKEGEIVSVGYLPVDTKARKDSRRLASSGSVAAVEEKVDTALDALQEQIDDIAEKAGSGYIPKGEATVATLNGLSGQENGNLYTMTDAGTLTDGSLAVVAGDTVAWDATNSVWYKAMYYAPRQYGTNEVHNLSTSITAFRTGDVIAVDGPSGTAKMSKDDLLKETADNKNLIRSKGYIYNDSTAIAAFGDSKSVDNAKNNTIYEIVASYVTGLPTGAGNGQLMTYMGVDAGGIANVQIYVDSVDYVPNMYVRKKLAGTFTEWKNITRGVSHIIPQFLKIGFVGDSVSSGASEYKDSDNNYHCIDNPEYSQVQCWGRERGVTALNLSQGGMTTRNWFTREKGYTRATTPGNECKCYFIMLGGNDIGEYHDLQDIGSTADVHVGNENLNADTYYGNYSKIIATLKSAGGRFTKIFAFTYPTIVNSSPYLVDYNAATREICALYDDVYVIELENDPVINGNQVRAEKYRGHFSAYGYKLMADRMEYLVDMYVEEHGSNFENIQFIGTNLDVQEWMS